MLLEGMGLEWNSDATGSGEDAPAIVSQESGRLVCTTAGVGHPPTCVTYGTHFLCTYRHVITPSHALRPGPAFVTGRGGR
jgi:hypothetical protein